MSRRLSAEERQTLSELNRILSETPQWSGEEELCIEMENIGGRVCFCHFWDEHYSMDNMFYSYCDTRSDIVERHKSTGI